MPEVEPLGIHIHKTWELAFIATGVGERETGGTIKAFSKGNLVLIPPGMPHEWRFGTDAAGGEKGVLITVNFASGLFAKLASAFPELEYMSKMFGDFSAASLVEILVRIAAERNPLVAGVSSHRARELERCRQTDEYIAATPLAKLNAEDAARRLGMQPTTFCNFFKKNYATNFVDYINEKKVENACALIKKGGRTLQSVCGESGFNSMVYFIRIFKRVKGITPARWARENFSSGVD